MHSKIEEIMIHELREENCHQMLNLAFEFGLTNLQEQAGHVCLNCQKNINDNEIDFNQIESI